MTYHDRALQAVRRVRAVREVDSRLGLQHALAEERVHRDELARLELVLGAEHPPGLESGAQLAARRTGLLGLGTDAGRAREAAAVAGRLSDAARAHWQADHTRLSAVATLLARRAEARRVARDRAEARELDEVAVRMWRRR